MPLLDNIITQNVLDFLSSLQINNKTVKPGWKAFFKGTIAV